MKIEIRQAGEEDAPLVADFAGRLAEEIDERTGTANFQVEAARATQLCREFIRQGRYTVLMAVDTESSKTVGVANLCQSHALYAGGTFGIIQEFYVLPAYRSQDVGAALLGAVLSHARKERWTRVELCTPPIPEFARTLAFYERNGYSVTGGRKMKILVD